jgi:hypothetical protein
MAKRTNLVAWGLAVVLAVGVLGGGGVLFVRLRPYWVAKYRGEGADLRGAALAFARLGRGKAEVRRPDRSRPSSGTASESSSHGRGYGRSKVDGSRPPEGGPPQRATESS